MKKKKRRRIFYGVIAVVTIVVLSAAYARYVEPHILLQRETELYFRKARLGSRRRADSGRLCGYAFFRLLYAKGFSEGSGESQCAETGSDLFSRRF